MPVDMSVANRIATVVINRPEKLNALDFETIRLLQEALSECEAESGVGAIVLTGAGDSAGAGADVADLAASIRGGTARALREVIGRGQGLTRRIENFPKPVVVAVNGLAARRRV